VTVSTEVRKRVTEVVRAVAKVLSHLDTDGDLSSEGLHQDIRAALNAISSVDQNAGADVMTKLKDELSDLDGDRRRLDENEREKPDSFSVSAFPPGTFEGSERKYLKSINTRMDNLVLYK
jgi:hypothetical protein